MKQVVKKHIKETHNLKTEDFEYTLLVDGNSIMKRSMVHKKYNGKGEDYGMVLQTLLTLRNIVTVRDFKHCYFMMDGDNSGQLRAYIYKDYKANRDKNYRADKLSEYGKLYEARLQKMKDYCYSNKKKTEELPTTDIDEKEIEDASFRRQRGLLVDILENLFIRTAIYEDVEGDDLIAYYIKNKKPNEKIIIISGDRDLTQLISDDVMIYILDLKQYVHKGNHTKVIGYPSENVLVKKILCGDTSDNIKGIKGLGESTLFKLFPKMLTEKMGLDEVIEGAKLINEERVKQKKKPLKTCENIINCITDGCQGENIYEVNRKIIDLSEPLITDETKEDMDILMTTPLDAEDRDYNHIYNIIIENSMEELLTESKFGSFFSPFNKIIDNEKKYKGD